MSTLSKIVLAMILTITVLFSLLILMVVNILFSSKIATVKHTFSENKSHTVQTIETIISFETSFLNVVQQSLALFDPDDENSASNSERILKAMIDSGPSVYSAWYIIDKSVLDSENHYLREYVRRNGETLEVFYGSKMRKLDEISDSLWYYYPYMTGRTYYDFYSLYNYDPLIEPMYTITVSAPILRNGMVIGVCGVNILYERLFESILPHGDERNEHDLMLLSRDMTILYSTFGNEIDTADLPEISSNVISEMRSTLLGGEDYLGEVISPMTGLESLVSLSTVALDEENRNILYLYTDAPLSMLYGDIYNVIGSIVIASILCLLCIIFIVYRSTNKLIKPIRELTGYADKMAMNDFSEDHSMSFLLPPMNSYDDISEKSEIATLWRSFTALLDTLHKNIQAIAEAEVQKQAAQAANEAKSQFLAKMSHEIRTPMNAILGMSEFLLSVTLNKRQQQCIEDIHTSAKALLELINDILDLSKIQASKLSLSPVHYSLEALIDNLLPMVNALIGEKKITFMVKQNGEIPGCLYGDEVRVRQVLLNLLSNAIKFTNEGSVNLTVNGNGANLSITVSDTGIGIAQEDMPMLFNLFEQASGETNRTQAGTGLGLNITKALVEMMGGKIKVESVYGRGSTFSVSIPMVAGNEGLIRRTGDNETVMCTEDTRALVVDDRATNIHVASNLLSLSRITTDEAMSGRQAIEMTQQNHYDLIFMDHMMPEMDGVETTRRIRENGVLTPIIALTANAIMGVREMLLQNGMDDFMSKPIQKSALNRVLRQWLPSDKLCTETPETFSNTWVNQEYNAEFWQKINLIDGLSIKTGLSMVSGRGDVYMKLLELLTNEIIRCGKSLGDYLTAQDMNGFRIEVHGMRSSLKNIGADGLAEQAHDLESASGKMDVDYCNEKTPKFLVNLERLGVKLQEAFSDLRLEQEPLVVTPELQQSLDRITIAFDKLDVIAIDAEVERIDGMDLRGALKDEVERIKDAIMMMDYDNASTLMQRLYASSSI